MLDPHCPVIVLHGGQNHQLQRQQPSKADIDVHGWVIDGLEETSNSSEERVDPPSCVFFSFASSLQHGTLREASRPPAQLTFAQLGRVVSSGAF